MKKNFRKRYAEIEQRKQRFHVGNVEVSVEVKPWPVKTKTGLRGGIETVAIVEKNGLAAVGRTVCIPTDEFNFRFGAKLALERAMDVTFSVQTYNEYLPGFPTTMRGNIVSGEIKGKIWKEFNRVLPK